MRTLRICGMFIAYSYHDPAALPRRFPAVSARTLTCLPAAKGHELPSVPCGSFSLRVLGTLESFVLRRLTIVGSAGCHQNVQILATRRVPPGRVSVDNRIMRASERRSARVLLIPTMIRITRINEYCPF